MAHIDELFEFDFTKGKCVIGTDEAGRGSAVGDVFSSAVSFSKIDNELKAALKYLNDSKKLSAARRDEL